jgi:hypothetical protein
MVCGYMCRSNVSLRTDRMECSESTCTCEKHTLQSDLDPVVSLDLEYKEPIEVST